MKSAACSVNTPNNETLDGAIATGPGVLCGGMCADGYFLPGQHLSASTTDDVAIQKRQHDATSYRRL